MQGASGSGRTFAVPQRSVDSLCREAGIARLDLLKLDVEGYEPEALRGGARTIAASPDIAVLIECNPALLARRKLRPEAVFDEAGRLGLVPRLIGTDHALGAPGVIDRRSTRYYLMMREARWAQLELLWHI